MNAQYAIGIDLGGTTFTTGIFDKLGNLLHQQSANTPVTENPDAVADSLVEVVRQLIINSELDLQNAVGLAIGFPGPVDPSAGLVKRAPNLPCLDGYHLADALTARLDGLPAYVQNDAYCATLAELRWGAGKSVDNLVMLTLGTGVGGGVALNNKVIRGPRQILGEIGHMILDPSGRRCGCGNFGCFEALAARDAIIELAARQVQSGRATLLAKMCNYNPCELTPKMVADASTAGDFSAIKVWDRVGFVIGIALCNIIVLTDPDLIILGGGIAAAGDVLFEPVRRTVKARHRIGSFDVSRIVPAAFANDAGVCGAGALAWEHNS